MYVVEGIESGEVREFRTKAEALKWIKDVQRFDRDNGLTGERFSITEEQDGSHTGT